MVLYDVTTKQLQNIHKVMQSDDNTFISIIYFQIKSLHSECMFKCCFAIAVCRAISFLSSMMLALYNTRVLHLHIQDSANYHGYQPRIKNIYKIYR